MSRFRVSSTPYDNDATTIQRNPVVAGMGPHGFSKSAVYTQLSNAFPHLYSDHQWVLSQIANSTCFVGLIGVNTNRFASVGMQPKTEAKETRLQSFAGNVTVSTS